MFFLIDKPAGISSFSAVAKVRKTLSAKKAGHTGTLDPLASGLLVIATEGSTKLIPYLENERKTYVFSVDFSRVSESLDLGTETESVDEKNVAEAGEKMKGGGLEKALTAFRGKIRQVPPKYSALRIDGKRAYHLARKGADFELEEREVEIFRLRLERLDFPFATFEVEASAGTYVRSLARDIGATFETGAVVTELRRTKIGNFDVERATVPYGVSPDRALDPRELFPDFGYASPDADTVKNLVAGIPMPSPVPLPDGRPVLVHDGSDYVSLCRCEGTMLVPLRNAIG